MCEINEKSEELPKQISAYSNKIANIILQDLRNG